MKKLIILIFIITISIQAQSFEQLQTDMDLTNLSTVAVKGLAGYCYLQDKVIKDIYSGGFNTHLDDLILDVKFCIKANKMFVIKIVKREYPFDTLSDKQAQLLLNHFLYYLQSINRAIDWADKKLTKRFIGEK